MSQNPSASLLRSLGPYSNPYNNIVPYAGFDPSNIPSHMLMPSYRPPPDYLVPSGPYNLQRQDIHPMDDMDLDYRRLNPQPQFYYQ